MQEQKQQNIAIIPARQGSKGILRKNLQKIGGIELIAHTIKAALGAECVGRVFVSTDSAEIADVARSFGAQVPFLRPPELAADSTPMIDVLVDFLKTVKLSAADHVLLLQPTSPLRTAASIDLCMRTMLETGAGCAVSLSRAAQNPFWLRTLDPQGRVRRLPGFEKDFACRQELPEFFVLNGAVYISTPELILNQNRLLDDAPAGVVIPECEAVDIDTPEDLEAARRIFEGNRL